MDFGVPRFPAWGERKGYYTKSLVARRAALHNDLGPQISSETMAKLT